MGARNRNTSFNRGRWEVQRERLRLEEKRPPQPAGEPAALADIVPSLLKRLGLEEEHWLGALNEEWATLVGADIARHARPGRMDAKVLTVFVDSSVWLSELSRFGKRKMLEKLVSRFGADRFKGLRLQIDPDLAAYKASNGRGRIRSTSSRK